MYFNEKHWLFRYNNVIVYYMNYQKNIQKIRIRLTTAAGPSKVPYNLSTIGILRPNHRICQGKNVNAKFNKFKTATCGKQAGSLYVLPPLRLPDYYSHYIICNACHYTNILLIVIHSNFFKRTWDFLYLRWNNILLIYWIEISLFFFKTLNINTL